MKKTSEPLLGGELRSQQAAGRLIGEGEDHDAPFRLRHLMAVQNAPDVAIATGKFRAALVRLT